VETAAVIVVNDFRYFVYIAIPLRRILG